MNNATGKAQTLGGGSKSGGSVELLLGIALKDVSNCLESISPVSIYLVFS
jgi:hypothetical protein